MKLCPICNELIEKGSNSYITYNSCELCGVAMHEKCSLIIKDPVETVFESIRKDALKASYITICRECFDARLSIAACYMTRPKTHEAEAKNILYIYKHYGNILANFPKGEKK